MKSIETYRQNHYYSFNIYSPRDIIKKIRGFYVSRVLDESTETYNDMLFTDSPYTIRDYCVNRPDAYRILYDANIDLYMLCDASLYIHWDLIQQAFKLGYYSELKNDEDLDPIVREYVASRDLFNYTNLGVDGYYEGDDGIVEFGQYLMYAIWVPNGMNADEIDNSPSSDGYDDEFEFPAGSLFTRGLDTDLMNKVDLINILKRSQSSKLTESVSETFLAKLTSAWGKDTCHPAYINRWTEQNPAAGQCLVTALAVQDEYGGDIYDCKVGRSRHFYNVINGNTVDLTFNQFPEGSEIKDARKRDRKQLLANKELRQRYELLKSRMEDKSKVIKETKIYKPKQVELDYDDLEITVTSPMDWDGNYQEETISTAFTYRVDQSEVEAFMLDYLLSDQDCPLLKNENASDEEFDAFFEIHFEELFEKYYDAILDGFEYDARKACESGYGWNDYTADERDDYADFLYNQRQDSQFESIVEKPIKLTIIED